MNIATTLAAIRRHESQDNYLATKTYPGGKVGVGAYQITKGDWSKWSAAAGVPGADWRSPEAQDRVAAHAVTHMMNRYGNPELVALAWYAGSNIADEVARAGIPIEESPFQDSIGYIHSFRQALDETPFIDDSTLPDIPQQASSAWLMPVAGENTWTDSFHYHRTAAQIAAGKSPVHEGIDIMAARGTPIVAPVAGEVVGAGYGDKGGHWVKIKGDDGIDYYFAHMDQSALVGSGTRVGQGFHLGFVGNSGNARDTKPHLHFTMHNSSDRQLLNPTAWLDGGGTASGQYRNYSHEDHVVEPARSSGLGFVDPFIETASNAVSGGTRIDYRTFNDDELNTERDADQIELGANPWSNE